MRKRIKRLLSLYWLFLWHNTSGSFSVKDSKEHWWILVLFSEKTLCIDGKWGDREDESSGDRTQTAQWQSDFYSMTLYKPTDTDRKCPSAFYWTPIGNGGFAFTVFSAFKACPCCCPIGRRSQGPFTDLHTTKWSLWIIQVKVYKGYIQIDMLL